MQVGIEGNYTMEEEKYIRTNCSKPQHFINLIKNIKKGLLIKSNIIKSII